LLACGEQELLERYDREVAARGKLKKATERSIVDRDKLIEHLRRVAAQGWAMDLEESALGLACAAAPVHDGSGRMVAALSVSGPSFRLDRDELEGRVVPLVVRGANALSRQLGCAG